MKTFVCLLMLLIMLFKYYVPAIATPTHVLATKNDKVLPYTVNLQLRGGSMGGVRMQLSLAGHTASSDIGYNEWLPLRASKLAPGIYTIAVTLLGFASYDSTGHETIDTTVTGSGSTNIQTLIIGPPGAVKLLSVGNNLSPGYVEEGDGIVTNVVWEWGDDPQAEEFAAVNKWLAHQTINHIGDTCKIVFYIGPNAAAYHLTKPARPENSSQSPVLHEQRTFADVLTSAFKADNHWH